MGFHVAYSPENLRCYRPNSLCIAPRQARTSAFDDAPRNDALALPAFLTHEAHYSF